MPVPASPPRPDPRLVDAASECQQLGYRSSLDPREIEWLRELVGPDHVFVAGDDRLERYGRDETEDLFVRPAAAVRVGDTATIATLLRWAQAERIPVTPWAAGTSLSGAAIPVFRGLVLSLERLNRILEIDDANLFATVEPGVITQVLQEAVAERGWFYPPDPASRGSCTIGGNLAMNSGGPRCVKYGTTMHYVTGLEVVLPTGEVIRVGGKLLKNVTGYNLVQTFVGSEGTLGIITEATLKLLPAPRYRRLVLAPFADVEACAACVAALFAAGLIPSACELMTQAAIRCTQAHLGHAWPHADTAAAQLLLELDGHDEQALDRDLDRLGEVCQQAGALDTLLADTASQQADLWRMRRAMGEAVKREATYREEDTVVPRAQLPALVRAIEDVSCRWNARILTYGHAGDGNLHVNILKQHRDGSAMPDDEWDDSVPKAIAELFRRTVALSGTITGEHGIGFFQREYLPLAQ